MLPIAVNYNNMTLKEQMQTIRKKAIIKIGGLAVEVIIEDYKNSYGNDRWLVKPVAGHGQVWIQDIELIA